MASWMYLLTEHLRVIPVENHYTVSKVIIVVSMKVFSGSRWSFYADSSFRIARKKKVVVCCLKRRRKKKIEKGGRVTVT